MIPSCKEETKLYTVQERNNSKNNGVSGNFVHTEATDNTSVSFGSLLVSFPVQLMYKKTPTLSEYTQQFTNAVSAIV